MKKERLKPNTITKYINTMVNVVTINKIISNNLYNYRIVQHL